MGDMQLVSTLFIWCVGKTVELETITVRNNKRKLAEPMKREEQANRLVV